jgi:hypothetical protein
VDPSGSGDSRSLLDNFSHPRLSVQHRKACANHAGGSPEKARPWFEIRDLVLKTLRDSEGRRMLLTDLVQTVRAVPAIKADFIEDTPRMMASMGIGNIDLRGEKIWYGLSPLMHGDFDRKDYLSTFGRTLCPKPSRRFSHSTYWHCGQFSCAVGGCQTLEHMRANCSRSSEHIATLAPL